MNNFVKLYCDITEHWLWHDPVKLKWWLDIFLLSQRTFVGCEKGEIPLGIADLAKRWKSSKSTVFRFIDRLSKSGLVRKVAGKGADKEISTMRIIVCSNEPYMSERSIFGTNDEEAAKTSKPQTQDAPRKEQAKKTEPAPLDPDQAAFMESLKKNYPSVMSMSQPLTYEQCSKLAADGYSSEQIRSILSQMENYKGLCSKYKSAYLTASNWLKRTKQ